jgi:tight adherence protein B
LPLCVGTLVWLTSPDYIELLWTAELGRFMMMGCVVWMSIGIFVMKKMINFDF